MSNKKLWCQGNDSDGIVLIGLLNGSAGPADNSNHTVRINLTADSVLDLSGNAGDSVRISGVENPVYATDAATKAYVDNLVEGLDIKASVRTSDSWDNITALQGGGTFSAGVITFTNNGALTIDGILLGLNDRVLIGPAATATKENGIYYVSNAGSGVPAVLTRALDCNEDTEFHGATVFVESGTNAGKRYHCLFDDTFDVNDATNGGNEWTQYGASSGGGGGTPDDNSVSTQKLVNGAVTADKLAANAVTTAKIADGAVTTDELGDLAVTAGKLASDAVTTAKIADGAVTAAELNTDAVTESKIAANAVTAGKIATDAVTADKIQNGAVTSGKLGSGAVQTAAIGDTQVTSGKLASNAVTTDKINDGAVTNAKIATDAVQAAQIQNGAVTNVKLHADALYSGTGIALGVSATGARVSFQSGQFTGLYGTGTNNLLMDEGAGNKLRLADGSTVDGDFTVDGHFTAGSWSACEEKWKDELRDVEDPLSQLRRLQPKTWIYKADAPICAGQRSAGFLAQNLSEVFPESVRHDARLDGRVVNDKYVLASAVAAINELSAAVSALQARCDALEARLASHAADAAAHEDHCCVSQGCITPCQCDAH